MRTTEDAGFSELIPSPWSLLPLDEWASAVALGEELPQQLDLEEIFDGSRRRRVEDLETPSLWHFLTGGAFGVYLPVDVAPGHESEDGWIFGSSRCLRDECAEVATKAGFRPPFTREIERRRRRLASRKDVYAPWGNLDLEIFSLLVLHEAASRSVERSLAINLLPIVDPKPVGQPIYDRVLDFQGFLSITSVRVSRAGLALRIAFPSGYAYEVPLDYLLTWFSEFEALRHERRDLLTITQAGRLRGAIGTIHLTVQGRHSPPATIYLSSRSLLTWCEPDFDSFAWPFGEPEQQALRPSRGEAEALRIRTGPPPAHPPQNP